MTDFKEYYDAMGKLELVTVPDWVMQTGDNDSKGKSLPEINLWLDSWVIANSGHRGSGKSELATALAIRSKWIWPELRIISNYPIKWAITARGKFEQFQSEPLDIYRMITFDEGFKRCLIILDESPATINRMGAASNKNRFFNLWLQQIRKNQSSLIVCSQDFKLIDYEVQYQTDILIDCRDAFRRYPNSGVKRGGVVLMSLMDMSGQWTGYKYSEYPKVRRRRLNAEYLWGTFDTHYKIDILEQMWRLQVEKETMVVSGGNGGDDAEVSDLERVLYGANMAFRSVIESGGSFIACEELYRQAGAVTQSQRQAIGKWLSAYGITRRRIPGKNDWHYTNLEKISSIGA